MKPDPYRGKIRCPRCGYPLLGLPPVHSCPECGLDYDPYSTMYRVRRRSRGAIYTILVPGAISIIIAAMTWSQVPVVIGLSVTFVLPVVVSVYRQFISPRPAIVLFLDRSGIRLEEAGAAPVVVRWSEFGKAYASWAYPAVHIKDRQGRRINQLDGIMFGSLAGACARKMNELAELYATMDLTPGEHSSAQPQK